MSGMNNGVRSTLMEMPDVHVARVAFRGQGGFGNGCIFCCLQIRGLDVATQEEAPGGEIMDNGTVAHP
jgi:hypothetical protein